MSDLFSGNEDFEKVDADQDENVTSTSMTGDMAEEDRYTGSGAQNDIDLLGDFAGGEASNEANSSEPLISFGSHTPIQESVSDFPPHCNQSLRNNQRLLWKKLQLSKEKVI